MLPVPKQLHEPTYEPLLRVCSSVLLTVQEVAKHLRYQVPHMHNMRNRGRGPAHVKLEGGAIRYQLSEVMRWQIHGHRGPWTPERVSLALAVMPGMQPEQREAIMAHLVATLDTLQDGAP